MYITYQTKGEYEYAILTKSTRVGDKVKKTYENLGRVLDKERGIYQNRERGAFTYDIKTETYGICPADFCAPKPIKRGMLYTVDRKRYSLLLLRFGDIFFFDSFLRSTELLKCIDAIPYSNKDTLHAIIAYYALSSSANYYAQDWYELTYAKILYPTATMASQRISEFLAFTGTEECKRVFFRAYYEFVKKCQMNDTKGDFGIESDMDDAVLIDSCGLPNDALLPITSISNHNGIISLEFRLIYVVQQKTGLPLFFRYVSGNVIDASTIKRTIAELKGHGINTKFALLDSGYYNSINADILIEAGISFISRVGTNHGIYQDAVKNLRTKLEVPENLVPYNGRVYYIMETPVKIGQKKDKAAYGYFCLDTTMRNEKQKSITVPIGDDDWNQAELFDSMQNAGLFMLICTRRVSKNFLLGLYYTRNQVEELFKIGQCYGKMLPICVESLETLRGHLLMTFITTTITKILMDRLLNTGWSPELVYNILQFQCVQIYPDCLVTSEPVKKMNDIYKHFKMVCPTIIEYKATDEELRRMGAKE